MFRRLFILSTLTSDGTVNYRYDGLEPDLVKLFI